MKRIVCVFIICCACVFTSACGYRNNINVRYTLNAVVEKIDKTDAGVTVEISPVSRSIDFMLDSYYPLEGDPYDIGRAVYSGNYDYYGNTLCTKASNALTYSLKWDNDYDALTDMVSDGDGNRIIKFTVSEGRILMFEDTYCSYVRLDMEDAVYNDSEVYYND